MPIQKKYDQKIIIRFNHKICLKTWPIYKRYFLTVIIQSLRSIGVISQSFLYTVGVSFTLSLNDPGVLSQQIDNSTSESFIVLINTYIKVYQLFYWQCKPKLTRYICTPLFSYMLLIYTSDFITESRFFLSYFICILYSM